MQTAGGGKKARAAPKSVPLRLGPSVILNAKQMTPAAWWSQYGKHLPTLSGIATKVLAQPVCASAAKVDAKLRYATKPKG